MLKNKFVVLAMLPLMLSACGGGGDSSGNNSSTGGSTTAPIQEKVTVDLYNVDQETLLARKYSYVDNVIKGTTYYTPLSENEFLLTGDQLFTDTWVYSDTKAINALKFYFSDAPKTGYYHTYKKIDISGENVFDRFYPDYKVIFDKFEVSPELENTRMGQAYNRSTPLYFPQNSFCYQIQEEIVGKPYITFSKEDMTGEDYAEVFSGVENNFKNAVKEMGNTYKVNTGKWKGHSWRYYREYDSYGLVFDIVVINYNGQLVFGRMHNFEGYLQKDLINQHTQRLNAMEPNAFVYGYYVQKAVIANLTKGCAWFNDIAAETIKKL
ncbi:hypothetical protein EXE30_07450 [Acinetobacter halotolerans]|uniref:Lipoprotein n=1 Tax=Acinetobacter halotolerans TaxID=1752076 RepID=A0A4V2DAZ1_9GAMM|nr:hypothetical protein [Acinetobacter halotolerans]RZF52959.1 hypothetical protein EXE30_07450 [Acinetobacter halotolerans]